MKNFEKTYRIISDIETLKDWVKAQTTFDFAFDTETTSLEYDKLKLVGCSFYNGNGGAVFIQFNFSTEVTRVIPDRNNKSRKITKIDLFEKKDAIPVQEGLEVLKPLLEHPLTMANSKFDCKVMHKYGIELKINHDTFLLSYCLNSSTPNGLKENAKEHLKFEMVSYEETVGMKPGAIDWNKVDWKAYGRYGALDAYATYRLSKVLIDKLQALGTGEISPWNCYINVELPLVPVVVEMETSGVRIDVELLKDMKRRIEIREKELERKVYQTAGVEFNIGSSQQLAEILFDRLEMPVIHKTDKGARAVGEDTLKELSYLGYELPGVILEYRGISKLKSTYTDGLIDKVDSDGRLRGSFNQAGTTTGRFCIEGNQLIKVVGGDKPIKDIKPNDLVYCYDNEGKVRIRKVLNTWYKGFHDIVSVNWMSLGKKSDKDVLLCTPNHLIKTRERGWVEAQNLIKGERVFHLSRKAHSENGKERPRLYGANYFQEKEQDTIKREFFRVNSRNVVHHIDNNSANNSIDNLSIMTISEHTRFHTQELHKEGRIKWEHLKNHRPKIRLGIENPQWINKSKFALLRMLFVAGGSPTKTPMDFGTFMRKCILYGINVQEVSKRFNSQGEYISKAKLKKADLKCGKLAYKEVKLGFYRFKELAEYYGYTNHTVTDIKPFGKADVYDIEVEEFNNFIASEICVHNSSSAPNMQNLANNDEFPIKKAFIPADGYVFIGGDFSQLELRVMAHMGDDPVLIKTYNENPRADIHQKTADEVTLATHTNITRAQGKTLNFAVLYGMSGSTVATTLNTKLKESFQKGKISKEEFDKNWLKSAMGDKMVDGFYKAYKGFKRGGDLVAYNGSKTGYAETITGRRRYIPELQKKNTYEQGKRYAVSTWIQGSAADLVKLAMLNLYRRLIAEDLKQYCRFLIQVHDEVVLEVKEEYAEMIVPIMQYEFENVWGGFKVPLICDINQLINWYDLKVSPAKKEVKTGGGVDLKTLKILKVI